MVLSSTRLSLQSDRSTFVWPTDCAQKPKFTPKKGSQGISRIQILVLWHFILYAFPTYTRDRYTFDAQLLPHESCEKGLHLLHVF
jgi:hypothetical protein